MDYRELITESDWNLLGYNTKGLITAPYRLIKSCIKKLTKQKTLESKLEKTLINPK